jgi:sucrose phosphorylase
VLVEIHGHHLAQIAVADRVDFVYDFALPPLLLDALTRGDARPLRHWLTVRPANSITVLDTHDGIGVIDVGPDPSNPERPGLLDQNRLSELVEGIHVRSGGTSRLATGEAASNLDLYQVNCTYYDALGGNDEKYLAARLIQVLTPGIPQIYYVGLLAGSNDTELLARTGVGRDINRHRFEQTEIADALDRPVVRSLLTMLRWRVNHPAFAGRFEVHDAPDHELRMSWTLHGSGACSVDARIDAGIDLATGTFEVVDTRAARDRVVNAADDL